MAAERLGRQRLPPPRGVLVPVAGRETLGLGGSGDHPGVYFVRVLQADATVTGRVVLIE